MQEKYKKCFKCNKILLIDNFYKHKQMADGYLNKCKDCCKLDVVSNYNKNKEYYREYDRKRAMLPHRIKLREEYKKTEAFKISKNKTIKKYRTKNIVKYKATSIVNNAVRKNKIIKPNFCQICGLEKKLQGHHYDYNKPLDVIWVCSSCHNNIHKKTHTSI